jgi:Protein of unknown function (DUF3017)
MTAGSFGALWLVAAVLISGMTLIGLNHVRPGGFLVAGALVVAGLLRLMLPRARAGALVVRSRAADVLFLVGMGLTLFVIVVALDLRPRP